MARTLTLDHLRRYAVARTLFRPTTLKAAFHKLGFVQADPIRAPARAQDLILRHRVKDYRAGDLERRYSRLDIAEDFFVAYGFLTTELQALMHPRPDVNHPFGRPDWPAEQRKRARQLLDYIRERGPVHPREVEAHFAHGSVVNYWGGSSNATTQMLDALHFQGVLRVVRRDAGIRVYAVHQHNAPSADATARLDALVDAVVHIYAPLPSASVNFFMRHLRWAVPQWRDEMGHAITRAKQRLAHAVVEGVHWYWPVSENPARSDAGETVRLLAPFDPIVRDRERFELLWNWIYRFEAYTPVAKRVRGYYALPLLWRDRVIGWANLAVRDGRLLSDIGYVESRPPRDPAFARELEAELERVRLFLALD